jgi:inosose dehydratase
MIGISFHSGGLADKPLAWVIEHLSSVGYDAIEIVCGPQAHIKPDEATESHLQEIGHLLEHHGLRVAAINPYTVRPLPEMEGAGDFYRRLIDIAATLRAPTVNFLTGRPPGSDADGWRTLIGALKPLLHYAGERGVCMTIHNHENQILDTPDKVLLLIETVGLPNLKALVDITNFFILGYEIPYSVKRLAPHILHCHIKGVVGRFPFNHFLVPGEPGDELPFAPFAAALGEAGYTGNISVETFSYMREDKARLAHAMIAERLRALGLRGR